MTAFKHLQPWNDFQKGQDSDMLRRRKRFEEMLERMHTKTMSKYSEFKTAKDENEAHEIWADHRDRKATRRKVKSQKYCMCCPACSAKGW